MARNDERDFRLRPRKPSIPRTQNEPAAWATAFKTVMHYVRASTVAKRANRIGGGSARRASIPKSQRCAIRVTYTRNAVRGQWRAHGRYLSRESAAGEQATAGFDRAEEGIEIGARLESWQAERDQRLWKIIISPEFGDRVDLTRLTRDMMARVERDLGTPLEWVAVVHHNTEHPHVHVALRGVGQDRRTIRLNRDYLKQGIRSIAEDLDAAEAERGEIREKRYTSLDQAISRSSQPSRDASSVMTITMTSDVRRESELARVRQQHIAARLSVLEDMGLSQRSGPSEWTVRSDFESVLRAMQRAGDRQKILSAHGEPMSDQRLPIEVLDFRNTSSVEGRVLVHAEDEQSGRSYLMLEGTDARVHFIHYTPEIEAARSRGQLRTNSFVRFRRIFVDEEAIVQAEDLGDSDAILDNRRFLGTKAEISVKKGILPSDDGWGGWLGRYQSALRKAAMEVQYADRAGNRRARDRTTGR
jgi:type IV secretory pathway VirD2 relaxase